jgi:hypothetical protein
MLKMDDQGGHVRVQLCSKCAPSRFERSVRHVLNFHAFPVCTGGHASHGFKRGTLVGAKSFAFRDTIVRLE